MSFDFPANPPEGTKYAPAGGPAYIFASGVWKVDTTPAPSGGVIVVSDTPPASPAPGTLWYESDTGNTYIWYTDADSSQWVQQNVNTPGPVVPAEMIASPSADMFAGFAAGSPPAFRVNDKLDGTGIDRLTVDDTGHVYGQWMHSNGGAFIGASNQTILGTPSGVSGSIKFRPNGYGDSTNEMVVNSNGIFTCSATYAGAFSNPGSSSGTQVTAGRINTSVGVTTGIAHYSMYNPNGNVGQITTTGSATAYGTSSDETMKDFIGPYDPLKAIDIIRADPVRDFTWKASGEYAVGWGAQTSHAVDPHLAVPGAGTKGEDDYMPWSIDQGKRTPYLWAALAWALDRIDDLEARLSALEAAR